MKLFLELTCPECKGEGDYETITGDVSENTVCPSCDGDGVICKQVDQMYLYNLSDKLNEYPELVEWILEN